MERDYRQEKTLFVDKESKEILPTNLVFYTDEKNGVTKGRGYIVKNLIDVWEVRHENGQTGNNLENVKDLEIYE